MEISLEERPVCPDCGQELVSSGKRRQSLQTVGGQEVTLEREYGVCPACGGKLFPLDEELELLPGSLTPGLEEMLVRLGSWMPFAQAQGFLVGPARTELRTFRWEVQI